MGIRGIARWAPQVLLSALLSAVVALGVTRLHLPEYRASVELSVWPTQLDIGLQQGVQGVMRNYAAAITSRENAQRVNDRLQLDLTPEELSARVIVTPLEDAFALKIEADDSDPLTAQGIAQTAAEVLVESVRAQMLDNTATNRMEIRIRDSASPGVLHKPKPWLNAAAAALFGLLFGIALVPTMRRMEAERLRSAGDLRACGLTVLGVIPDGAPGSSRRGIE